MSSKKVAVVVPTLNASSLWDRWVEGMRAQRFKPEAVLIVDSDSDDDTVSRAEKEGYHVHAIRRSEFNHGGTRQAAVQMLEGMDIVVFLTQDAILASEDSIGELVDSFKDESVGAAYGRQLPRREAGPLEAHARLFNYPGSSSRQTGQDIPRLGLKTAFISNSFSAYRVAALKAVGGFPNHVIVSEDMHVAARMIVAGWAVHYNADAVVEHSHGYTPFQEFQRYFDVGVFHSRERWILEKFGAPSGEGLRFVLSEWKFLGPKGMILLPSSIIRTALKLIGYHMGRQEPRIPLALKRRISMQKSFWRSH